MTSNIVLDVAIGLVFIYLLYSLLATTIQEFVATIFSYRSRMLERGLEQMLDGKNYSYYWWDRLWNFLYARNKRKSDGKYFIKTNLFTNLISCHPLYVRSGENSITSSKPSYLGADIFSDILIDILKSDDKQFILLKDIAKSIKEKAADKDHPLNRDLEQILSIYMEQANGDLQKFKLLIENWYDDTMDRVSGWYKKQTNWILFVIGLCLAIAFNISTIDIVRQLSVSKAAREGIVKSATDYINDHKLSINSQPADKRSLDSDLKNNLNADNRRVAQLEVDSTNKKNDTGKSNINTPVSQQQVNRNNDAGKVKEPTSATPNNNVAGTPKSFEEIRSNLNSIDAIYKLTDSITSSNTSLGLGWGDFGQSEELKVWNEKGKPEKEKPSPKNSFEKIIYVLWETITTPHYWLGFLITGLAISLGAPFWFDLLNKFVNLRVSGAKPDSTPNNNKSSTPVSKTAALNQKPAINSFA
jgi:hypothetical protein